MFHLYLAVIYIRIDTEFDNNLSTTYKEGIIMAYVIGNDCVSCGSCEGQCPVGAISMGDGKFEIDANTCISCGSCAGVCPVGAISQE